MWIKHIVMIILINVVYCKYVGETCTTKEETEGICRKVSDCKPAEIAIRNKIYDLFERCGFNGFQEVVCCPQSTTTKFGENTDFDSGISSKRVADRECEKIINNSVVPLALYILGGEIAALGEFPHMVALGFDRGNGYEFDCGGSVLSPKYVLSAAHCVVTKDGIQPSIIRGGVVEIGANVWNPETDVKIAQIIVHPEYQNLLKYNDITLLRLETPLRFSPSLNAICLETNNADPTVPLTITGWGKTSNMKNIRSDVLLKANVTFVRRDVCTESYTNWRKLPSGISDSQLCAGDPEGVKDACQGDSGGPIVMSVKGYYRLVGLTSFGRGCGSPIPGVYTRVSGFIDWIESIVWPN